MAIKLGMNAKMYRNTGDYETPVWAEMPNVKDVSLNLETGSADATTRGNGGWRATLATLREGSVEFDSVWDTDDEGFTAMQQAYFSNGTIEVAVMDGDITAAGTEGLRATMSVTNFSRNEPLEEAITASISLKPAYAVNPPEWMVVS
jgi:predicted secreted protein